MSYQFSIDQTNRSLKFPVILMAGIVSTVIAGYAFAADRVLELDPLNPQIAARLARAFDRWSKFGTGRQAHARAALERIRGAPALSRDVAEVVTKALEQVALAEFLASQGIQSTPEAGQTTPVASKEIGPER